MSDPVSAPAHYAGNGEIDAMTAMQSMMSALGNLYELSIYPPMTSYWWGCAFKYLWRWPMKNGLEDLLKCRQCLDYLIAEVEND